jgi:hypothetical protein
MQTLCLSIMCLHVLTTTGKMGKESGDQVTLDVWVFPQRVLHHHRGMVRESCLQELQGRDLTFDIFLRTAGCIISLHFSAFSSYAPGLRICSSVQKGVEYLSPLLSCVFGHVTVLT